MSIELCDCSEVLLSNPIVFKSYVEGLTYFTEAELKRIGGEGQTVRLAQAHYKSMTFATTKVFLAHSHVETELIEAARRILGANGAEIYIDSEDTEMPDSTTPETAEKLKVKISQFTRFVLLASEKSLNSRWVPWELGFADATKGTGSIAILPFTKSDGLWRGTEYVGLYPTIRPGIPSIGIYRPGKSEGQKLSDWLNPKERF